MDVMPWQAVVFISIPEAFLIMLMGLVLTGLKPDLKRLAMAAVIQAVGSYFIRGMNFPYGVHILIQLVTMAVLAKLCLRYRWSAVVPGILLGAAIFTGILDQLYFLLILKIVSLEVILNNAWIRVLVSLPEQAAMLVIILLCYKYNFKVFDVTVFEEGM
ncbi:MAG: hypothetical protein GX918_03915 [Clostridiales bacterium]|nr:hypothetical protein [Clostridiales bacterium]